MNARERALSLVSFLLPLALFLGTLPPGTDARDSGHWIALAHQLGSAPPGTPFYALLGKIFSLSLPFPSAAMSLHALSAVAMATYCWMLSRVMRGLLGSGPALVIALAAAVGDTAWDLGTRADPLPLAMAMVALQYLLYREIMVLPISRRLFALCFLAGIGIAVHPAGVAGIPLVASACWKAGRKATSGGMMALILGLSLFIYVPLRHPRTAYHPAGWDRVELSAALAQAGARVPGCFARVVSDHHPLLLAMAIPGLLLLARRHPRLALTLPFMGFLGLWASCLFPLTARSTALEALPFHPLLALSCGYLLTPAMRRRFRIWNAAFPLLVLGIVMTGLRNASPHGSRGELAPYVHARLVQDQIEPGGRLFHEDASLGFRLDHLRLVEGRRIDITREAASGGRLPVLPEGETRTFYLDFEPASVPDGYRLEHRGMLFLLVSADAPSPPPFSWERVPQTFFDPAAVRGDPSLERLCERIQAHRAHDEESFSKKN